MAEKKEDRRVRKTKKQLRLALTQLMRDKSIKEITVREIADLVDINRGTFYLHYKDIYDMVEQIEDEMFEGFHQVIYSYNADDIKEGTLPFFTDIFKYLAEYSDMCIALLGKNGDIAFVERLKSVVRNKCLYEWMKVYKKVNEENYEYFYEFIVSGCVGLINEWLEQGMKKTPEEIARLAEQIIMNGVKALA